MRRDAILLDTNVLSELMRAAPEPKVVNFVARIPSPFVSAAVFHELTFGVALLPEGARKTRMTAEIEAFRIRFDRKVVAIDVQIANLSGRLRADMKRAGLALAPIDALIAASAMSHSARLATRNVKHFQRLGLDLVDPWTE